MTSTVTLFCSVRNKVLLNSLWIFCRAVCFDFSIWISPFFHPSLCDSSLCDIHLTVNIQLFD